MKKRNLLCAIILILQMFTPFVSVATAVTNENEELVLSKIVIADASAVDPESLGIEITGVAKVASGKQSTVNLKGVANLTPVMGSIKGENQQVIGTYQTNEGNITLSFNQAINSSFRVELTGQLADKSTMTQTITATLNDSVVSTPITLKDSNDVKELENKEATEATTTEHTKPTQSDQLRELRREPIDISTLLNGQQLFNNLSVTNENGQDITNTNMELGDILNLSMDFNLPESVREQMQAGDYYEGQLPAEILLDQNLSINLTGPEGQIYGVMTINTDGSFRVEFSELVEQESNVHGNVNFSGELGAGDQAGPGPGEIEFPFVEGGPSIPIIIKPKTDDTIRKTGHPDRPTNPDEISWSVDVNVGLATLTNAKIAENFPEGTTYKPEVKVYTVDVDFDGEVIEGSEQEVPSTDYSVDAQGNVTFNGEISKAYRLEYTTTIDPDTKPGGEGGTVSYKNEATLSADELPDEIETSATIAAKYNKMLEKQKPVYDPENQEFKWTVNYNYTEFDISEEEATVRDEFQGEMILKEDSLVINKVTFDDQNNPIEGAPLVEGEDYRLVPLGEGEGFEIQFIGGLDYAVNVHYVTAVDEEVTGDQEYGNTVVDGQGHRGESTGEAHQQGLIKSKGEPNYVSKTIE